MKNVTSKSNKKKSRKTKKKSERFYDPYLEENHYDDAWRIAQIQLGAGVGN